MSDVREPSGWSELHAGGGDADIAALAAARDMQDARVEQYERPVTGSVALVLDVPELEWVVIALRMARPLAESEIVNVLLRQLEALRATIPMDLVEIGRDA